MCVPPFDEAIPNPFPPAQEEEDEVSHFTFQVFDDTLFCVSEIEDEMESHEEEALMLTHPFDEVIQIFDTPAHEEVNMVSFFPFQYFGDSLFCDLERK
jgi:hypothetical protein